jgi:hypothetical protein
MTEPNQQSSSSPKHCPATRKDGQPCQAPAGSDGWCIGHRPGAKDARSRGGKGKSRAARAGKLLPARLRPIVDRLEKALDDVETGKITPAQGQAMASLSRAIVQVFTAGELEERMRDLEKTNE